eukprot:scaffold14403_cov72-Skeletonema_dohrnii-CCMP3373.AAC.1
MNVTTAVISSAQSVLREATMNAINVMIATKFSASSVRRLGCVIARNAMTYAAMIVNFKNFERGSVIAQNASN